MRHSAFLTFALAGFACNGVLGIEEATLCEGSGCDAGVVREVTSGNQPGPAAARDAGADAGTTSGGGITTDGVVRPGVTPIDMSGSGSSGSNSGSEKGSGEGSGNGGSDAEGGADGNAGKGNNGAGNGSAGNGNGNNGAGNGNAGSGGGGNAEEEPLPPEPPPPPPSPCAGRAEGEAFCTGAVRTLCGAGAAVISSLPCASEAHCVQGNAGACAVCLAGEARCEGATLLACNATRSGLDTIPCASPAQCNAAASRCDAPACVPGETRCEGSVLQTCNAGLTGFDPIADCGTPAACNAQTASCILCTPGARRCVDAVTVATCDISGQFEVPTSCGVLEVCLNGDCEGLDAVPVLPGL